MVTMLDGQSTKVMAYLHHLHYLVPPPALSQQYLTLPHIITKLPKSLCSFHRKIHFTLCNKCSLQQLQCISEERRPIQKHAPYLFKNVATQEQPSVELPGFYISIFHVTCFFPGRNKMGQNNFPRPWKKYLQAESSLLLSTHPPPKVIAPKLGKV